jgi:MarR family transcriptional regulator, 2-MHQ and catechol-resistance regulon repressor
MPTRYQGSAAEVLALDLFIKLSRATDSLAGRLHQTLARSGLTPGQFGILEALYHIGPMSQTEIGRKLLRSNPNITTVIDNLEKDGLVRRERQSADRRVVEVSLTQKGRTTIRRVFPAHVLRITELLSVLTVAEQTEMGRLARKLGLAITGETQAPGRKAAGSPSPGKTAAGSDRKTAAPSGKRPARKSERKVIP